MTSRFSAFFSSAALVKLKLPVILKQQDIAFFQKYQNFCVPINMNRGEIITGHIDIVQVRNGMIHILDYKPNAKKEKPIEQLTIYALALSRLTGLRLYDFKCAWFDENDYFEFYPLHVVYKK